MINDNNYENCETMIGSENMSNMRKHTEEGYSLSSRIFNREQAQRYIEEGCTVKYWGWEVRSKGDENKIFHYLRFVIDEYYVLAKEKWMSNSGSNSGSSSGSEKNDRDSKNDSKSDSKSDIDSKDGNIVF